MARREMRFSNQLELGTSSSAFTFTASRRGSNVHSSEAGRRIM
ncbi:MAG: hypothetical protein M5U28_06095 [Sandaracinaceae bacterium]|nr:hypothetical protein [Sandaracinaceae bacterium]